MATVRPNSLPSAGSVASGDAFIVDNGATVAKATPGQIVDAAIPLASQAEAEAGTDNAKRVTPLRVKQAMDANMATTDALASTAPDKGAALVALLLGGTVQDAIHWVTPEMFGAKGDGSTDDTTAIQNAIAALTAGGVVQFGPKSYAFSDQIVVPSGVDLVGYAGGAGNSDDTVVPVGTVLLATAAAAQIKFYSASTQGCRGGVSGNFVLDGDSVGGSGTGGLLWIDNATQRQFAQIAVQDSAGNGCVITRTQNCQFLGLLVTRSASNNLIIDRGAGGLTFIGAEINAPTSWHLRIDESADDTWTDGDIADVGSGNGPYAIPTHIVFVRSIFERAKDTTLDGCVYVGASGRTAFQHCVFTVGGATITDSGPLIQIGGNTLTAVVWFEGYSVVTPDPDGVSIQQGSGATAFNHGILEIHGGSKGWKIDAGSADPGVLLNQGGLAASDLFDGTTSSFTRNAYGQAVNDLYPGSSYGMGWRYQGDANDLFLIDMSSGYGGIKLGPGGATAPGGVRWRMNGAAQAQFTGDQVFENKILLGSSSGPQVTSGTIAQSNTAVSHTGDTTETTLASITIPAGIMGANDSLEVEMLWSWTGTGNKVPRVRFGGTGGTAYFNPTVTSAGGGQAKVVIRANNSTSAQKGMLGSTFASYGSGTGTLPSSSVDTSSAVTLIISGSVVTTSESITLEGYSVKLVKAPA